VQLSPRSALNVFANGATRLQAVKQSANAMVASARFHGADANERLMLHLCSGRGGSSSMRSSGRRVRRVPRTVGTPVPAGIVARHRARAGFYGSPRRRRSALRRRELRVMVRAEPRHDVREHEVPHRGACSRRGEVDDEIPAFPLERAVLVRPGACVLDRPGPVRSVSREPERGVLPDPRPGSAPHEVDESRLVRVHEVCACSLRVPAKESLGEAVGSIALRRGRRCAAPACPVVRATRERERHQDAPDHANASHGR
jgi:hypothetical protein